MKAPAMAALSTRYQIYRAQNYSPMCHFIINPSFILPGFYLMVETTYSHFIQLTLERLSEYNQLVYLTRK